MRVAFRVRSDVAIDYETETINLVPNLRRQLGLLSMNSVSMLLGKHQDIDIILK